MGQTRNVYRVLVAKRERKWPLGRQGSVWEDNIKWMLKKRDGSSGLDLCKDRDKGRLL
jgi:hypothetical protein